ncbi:hypothetical protein [Amycolatopsis magusensis]|uniref:hypothetical protein n=1 Tax=Amycolatopsis magusensis TaxID=882444 RepID=UPI0037A96A51
MIARVADVLENRPRTAVDILRHWWASAPSDADRAIIAACAPKNGEQRRRPQSDTGRAPRWNGRNNYQAPSTVRTEQRAELRRRRKSRQEQNDAAAFRRYQAERAGVAEGEQIPDRDDATRAEQVYASGFDYDRAALYSTDVAFRCLSCSINRGRYDLDRARMSAGHGDDGLCAECRESGRPGIPELPAGHTLADAVTARCSFIWAERGTVAARVALRAEWRQAPAPAVRAAIADYVSAHLSAEQPAEVPAELSPCTGCPDPRTARDLRGVAEDDGLCAECRAADAAETAAA